MLSFVCSGWWEQIPFGRQPMNDLELAFEDGRVVGIGHDIVGEFELRGEIKEDSIYLRKQYIGKHVIDYHGTSMGEGGYGGQWSCNGIPGGRWFMRVLRQV